MPTKLKPQEPQSNNKPKGGRNAPGIKFRSTSSPSRPSSGFEPTKTRNSSAGAARGTAQADLGNYINNLEGVLDKEGVAKGDPAERAYQERLAQNGLGGLSPEVNPVDDFYNHEFGIEEKANTGPDGGGEAAEQSPGPTRTSGKFIPTIGRRSKNEYSEAEDAPHEAFSSGLQQERESLGSLIDQERADREAKLKMAKDRAANSKVHKFNLAGRGKKKVKKAVLGLVIAAVTAAPVGVIAAAPHAIEKWIEARAGEVTERAMDKITSRLVLAFLRDRAGTQKCKGYYNSLANVSSAFAAATGVENACRSKIGNKDGLVKDLFDDWQTADMEKKLAEDGLGIEYNPDPDKGGNPGKPYSISSGLDPKTGDPVDFTTFSDDVINDVDWQPGEALGKRRFSKQLRGAIKKSARDKTKWFQFLKRRNLKAGSLRQLNLPGRFYGPDSLAGYLDERDASRLFNKSRFKRFLARRIVYPMNGRAGAILDIILSGNSAEVNRTGLRRESIALNRAAGDLGEEAVDELIEKFSGKTITGAAQLVIEETLEKIILKATGQTVKLAGELFKAASIVGIVLLIFTLMDLLDLATDGTLQKYIASQNTQTMLSAMNTIKTPINEELRGWVDFASAGELRLTMFSGLGSSRVFSNTVGYESPSGNKAGGYECSPPDIVSSGGAISTAFSNVSGLISGSGISIDTSNFAPTTMQEGEDVCPNHRVDFDPLSAVGGVSEATQDFLSYYTTDCIGLAVVEAASGQNFLPDSPLSDFLGGLVNGVCDYTLQDLIKDTNGIIGWLGENTIGRVFNAIAGIPPVARFLGQVGSFFNGVMTDFLVGGTILKPEMLLGGHGVQSEAKTGARLFDAMTGGQEAMSNQFAKGDPDGGGLGAVSLSGQQATKLNNSIAEERQEELASSSLFDRFFDTSHPDTLASGMIAATLTGGGASNLFNPMQNIASIFNSGSYQAFAATANRASCSYTNDEGQAVTEFGIPCYGVPDESIDTLTDEELEDLGDPEACEAEIARINEVLSEREELPYTGEGKLLQDPDGSGTATSAELNLCRAVCTATDTLGTAFREDDPICGYENQSAAAPSGGSTTSEDYNTTDVPCAAGTTDVGNAKAYREERAYDIKLCSIPGFVSTGTEDVDSGINLVRVNSTISGDTLEMFNDMKAAGLNPSAVSSFRSNEFQTAQYGDGSSGEVAKPGTSNHQMGYAIDFAIPGCNPGGKNDVGKDRSACQDLPQTSPPCKNTSGSDVAPSAMSGESNWDWLNSNASSYKFKQLCFEAWHWEHEPAPVIRSTGGGSSGGCAAGTTKIEDTQTYVKGVPTDSVICSYDKFPSTGSEDDGVARFSAEVSAKVKEMVDAAAVDGVQLSATSSFRSYAKQEKIYNCYANGICEPGESYPDAARPGFSNHQSGNALDFSSSSPSWTWMRSNGERYGFKWFGSGDPVHWSTTGG